MENKTLEDKGLLLAVETEGNEKKYYLDGEEITESDYRAIKKYVKRFCSTCWQAKAQENLRLGQHFIV